MSLETHLQSSMHINPVALSEQGCPSDRNCSLQSYVHRAMEVLAELEVSSRERTVSYHWFDWP
jgi:hypothetical protein